jgi:hypothetical protein
MSGDHYQSPSGGTSQHPGDPRSRAAAAPLGSSLIGTWPEVDMNIVLGANSMSRTDRPLATDRTSGAETRSIDRFMRLRVVSTLKIGYPLPGQDGPTRAASSSIPRHVRTSTAEQLGRPRDFDRDHPEPAERLPRRLDVHIASVPDILNREGRPRVLPVWEGKPCGDMLSDNAYEDDGYRYHDAFHLAYLAVLGWSPVVRALLKRKRKAMPRIDEVEDGGRAIVTEEGISVFVFEAASRANYFMGASHVDPGVIDICRRVTSHLEVADCTAGEWEHAILDGYAAWRLLRAHGHGAIMCDLDSRSILARRLTARELDAHARVCASALVPR